MYEISDRVLARPTELRLGERCTARQDQKTEAKRSELDAVVEERDVERARLESVHRPAKETHHVPS